MNPAESESLMRSMAREFGGDPAATDSTPVLRLPGFYNKKYKEIFRVEAHRESVAIYHLNAFRISMEASQAPDAYAVGLVFLWWFIWRYNHRVIPKQRKCWDRSFMCQRCGHIMQSANNREG